MAPQEQAASAEASSTNSSTAAPAGQEQQVQSPPAPASGSQEQQQASTVTIDDNTQLPETHPLVARLAKLKETEAAQRSELQELRAKSAKVTQLETDLAARPSQEAIDTLQARYDRLEAFAQAVGIGKALDSRTFTKDLFESDKDIKDLVKDWNRDNPSATSQALAGKAGQGQGTGKHDPNELLRIAAGKQ